MYYNVHTISVVIEGSKGGLIGDNGTDIECIYTQDNIEQILTVSFMAFNKSSITFETIATYIPDKMPRLKRQGQYLSGRVTLTTIKQSSPKAVMTINNLMCIDNTLYRCQVIYIDSIDTHYPKSNNISISVQVPPTKPDSISLAHTPAESSVTTTEHMEYSTLSPVITQKEHETVSALQSATVHNTTTLNHSAIPTTDYDTTSSNPLNDDWSSNVRHRTTTYSTKLTTTPQRIVEGDSITVICTGDVGKPPVNHVFEKHLNGKIIPIQATDLKTSISEMYENCSYYRTSNFTFQITARDNNAVIRCVVNSSMAEPDMFVETEPIEVFYPVGIPTIINHPNKTDYVLGEDTSIHLTCKSDGNPKPSYYWYKENMKEQVSSNENFTIKNLNITDSGTYTCKVNNNVHGDTYQQSTFVNIKIINTADKTTPSISGSWLNKAKDNGTVIAIIVLIVIALVIALSFLLYRRIRAKEKYKPVDRMESNMDQIESQETTQTVPSTSSTKKTTGYEDVDLDDTDMKFKLLSDEETIAKVKQHNEEYLKKLKEDEDREKDNPTQPPQAAVYACVNKPKCTVTTENKPPAGQEEEDVYEESKEGLYDTSGDRRHKENSTLENYDSTEKFKNEESDDNDLFSEQNSKIGANINKSYGNSEHKEEKRQVATVSPTVRMSSSSQGDGQKRKSDEIQPKTEKLTTQETFL